MPQEITSSCIYCGVGCQLKYHVENNHIIKITGDPDDPISQGQPCIKGLAINEVASNQKNRLKSPQINPAPKRCGSGSRNAFKNVSWSKALEYVYQNTKDLAPNEVLFVASGKVTNEDNYILQKFARLVYQTNNIDSCCGRLCHNTSVLAMKNCFGTPNLTNIDDIKNIDTLLIIGSNPASNYPVFWTRVLKARGQGQNLKVLSVQSVLNLTGRSLKQDIDQVLIIKEGSEMVLLNGIVNHLINNDEKCTNSEAENFDHLKKAVTSFTPDFVCQVCEIKKGDFEKLCQLVSESKSFGVMHGMGITQHVNGTANIHSLLNLMIVKKGLIFTQRGEINVQGVGDVACEPSSLPSGSMTTAPQLEKIWGAKLPMEKGANFVEGILINPVKAIFLTGFNPAQSLPDLDRVHQNLKEMFVVVLESHHNLTCEFADVILPISMLFEHQGTITNGERRVRSVNKVIGCPVDAKPVWKIFKDLAKFFGKNQYFNYEKEAAIFSEIQAVIPDYKEIDKNGFVIKKKKFECFMPESWSGFDDPRSEQYPFFLTSFRLANAFLTNEVAGESQTLAKTISPGFLINPEDAQEYNLEDGDKIIVTSKINSLKGVIKISADIPRKIIGANFHFKKFLINKLFPLEFDPQTFTPNYKATAVRIRKSSS